MISTFYDATSAIAMIILYRHIATLFRSQHAPQPPFSARCPEI